MRRWPRGANGTARRGCCRRRSCASWRRCWRLSWSSGRAVWRRSRRLRKRLARARARERTCPAPVARVLNRDGARKRWKARITPHPPASRPVFAGKDGSPSRAPPSPSGPVAPRAMGARAGGEGSRNRVRQCGHPGDARRFRRRDGGLRLAFARLTHPTRRCGRRGRGRLRKIVARRRPGWCGVVVPG